MNPVAFTMLLFGCLLGAALPASAAEEPAAPAADTAAIDSVEPAPAEAQVQVIATYFHGNRRCATCRKLEAYAQEAVTGGFPDEIAAGVLQWRVVNFDEDANAHFLEDYELFSQAVILSRLEGGKETVWKNLDRIWTLVGDQEAYLAYVRSELRTFLAAGAD